MGVARLRIGNQTTWRAPAHLPYEFALRQGFDAFEWFSDRERGGWCERDTDAAARRRLRETAAARDIRFSVHVPYTASPFTESGLRAIDDSLAFAGDVGAAVVNIHLSTAWGIPAFAAALCPILEHARAVGVRVSIENVPSTTPKDFNDLFEVLKFVPEAAGHVGMCLDMGHAYLCPATPKDYLGYVDQLGGHVPIIHWHAHENWGDRDSHLPLFSGPSACDETGIRGLVQRLLQRGFQGLVILEQWPSPPELLTHAREQLLATIHE